MRSMHLNRRNLLQSVGLGSLGSFWPLSKLAAARPASNIYQQLGIRPVINCMGAWTIIGASKYFFFQAEDGIRDLTVTGVQTCALPICSALRACGVRRLRPAGQVGHGEAGDQDRLPE